MQPIIERSCQSCHTAGGVAPFALDRPEQVQATASLLVDAVVNRRMPPYFAATSCTSYVDDPRLSADELALLRRWVDEGTPLGDPAEERHASKPPPVVVRPDVQVDLGGDFDVRVMGATDNYRCFVLNPGNTTDVMVRAFEVVPGNRATVHHSLTYVVPPAQVAQLEGLDAADPGLGYRCQTGGVGIVGANRNLLAAWVPGQFGTRLPEGTALPLPAGSRLVMQVHYNLAALGDPSVSPLDRTQLRLETGPADLRRAQISPVLKPDLDIKAGDAASVQTLTYTVPPGLRQATVYRASAHAHQLATRVKLELLRADGSQACVLDNPDWDFNWQRDYTLAAPLVVRAGDRFRITCTYDNSAANQPSVDGVRQAPRDVRWGEGTSDEMCMTYLTFAP